jgi:hypothetical protein
MEEAVEAFFFVIHGTLMPLASRLVKGGANAGELYWSCWYWKLWQ